MRRQTTTPLVLECLLILFFHALQATVLDTQNGLLECDDATGVCTLVCDYGYVAEDKKVYQADEPDLVAKATCAETMAFIVGGSGEYDEPLSSVEIFSATDPLLGLREIAPFPYSVESPVALWVQGQVLVCGGRNTEPAVGEGGQYEMKCWEYSPCENAWREIESMTTRRGEAVGVVTADDLPWILGGKNTNPVPSTEMRNKTAGTGFFWSRGPELDQGKFGHCAVTINNSRQALITGGDESFKIVETFDLLSNTHETSHDLNHKRSAHACVAFTYIDWDTLEATEKVIVAGGWNERHFPLDSVETWDPVSREWSQEDSPSLSKTRAGAGMIILDKKPTLIGGEPFGDNRYEDAVALHDLSLGDLHWETVGSVLTVPRSFFGLVAVPVTLFDRCPP